MSRLQKAPKPTTNSSSKAANRLFEFVLTPNDNNNNNNNNDFTKKLITRTAKENSVEKRGSACISPIRMTPLNSNLSDIKRSCFIKHRSPQNEKKNKENFTTSSNASSGAKGNKQDNHRHSSPNSLSNSNAKLKPNLYCPSPSQLNFSEELQSKQRTSHENIKQISSDFKKFTRQYFSNGKNQDDLSNLHKGSNENSSRSPNGNKESQFAIKLDETRVINSELRIFDEPDVKSFQTNSCNQRNILIKELLSGNNNRMQIMPNEMPLINQFDPKKSFDSHELSSASFKKNSNMIEGSPKPYSTHASTYLSPKQDNLQDHAIWESFSKAYRNMIDEIKQDLPILNNFNSQFLKYFAEKSIIPSENFTYIIFDIKQIIRLFKVNNKECDKEEILKNHIATLLNHNHQLIDENSQLNTMIMRLESAVNSLNERLSNPEVSTPRLFGEIEQSKLNEKNVEDLIGHIKNLHEFYADKFKVLSKSITDTQSIEIDYKKLNEMSLEIPKCLDESFNIYIRNNMEIWSQIQHHLLSFRGIKTLESSNPESQTRSPVYPNDDTNEFSQNTKVLNGNSKLTPLQSQKIDQISYCDQNPLSKLLIEKENEIQILRKKELAYQTTIYSLSNELYELKKDPSKAKIGLGLKQEEFI